MKIVDRFIPNSFKSNSTDYSKAKLLTLIGYIALIFSLIIFVAYAVIGLYDVLYIMVLPVITCFIFLGLIRYSENLTLCTNYLIVSFLTLVTLFSVISNGIYSPYLIWMVAVIIAAYLLSGKKTGDIILVAIVFIILGLSGLKYFKIQTPEMIVGDWFSYFTTISLVMFFIYIVFLVNWYMKVVEQYQDELKAVNVKLKLSNIELERFAYVASHDMKTPIRNIISFLNLAERRAKTELSKDLQEYITYASSSAKELNTLIEDILNFQKLQNQKRNSKKSI